MCRAVSTGAIRAAGRVASARDVDHPAGHGRRRQPRTVPHRDVGADAQPAAAPAATHRLPVRWLPDGPDRGRGGVVPARNALGVSAFHSASGADRDRCAGPAGGRVPGGHHGTPTYTAGLAEPAARRSIPVGRRGGRARNRAALGRLPGRAGRHRHRGHQPDDAGAATPASPSSSPRVWPRCPIWAARCSSHRFSTR